MPEKRTIQKARRDKRQGKSANTQAGEFVHDEIKRIRKGEHGARNAKQAIRPAGPHTQIRIDRRYSAASV